MNWIVAFWDIARECFFFDFTGKIDTIQLLVRKMIYKAGDCIHRVLD